MQKKSVGSRKPIKKKPIQKKKKRKRINSAFLTLEEYKTLKDLTPNIKNLSEATFNGRRSFANRTNMQIDQESPYIFHDIKNGKEPIFIINKPLNVSVNSLKEDGVERLYKTSDRGVKFYYTYKGKKYFQKTRYDSVFDIHTRSGAPIYPYKTLKELKPRLKAHGFKRISKAVGFMGYISNPFRLTHDEKRLKELQKKK